MRMPWVGDDRVTVEWTQSGEIDDVIAAVVDRAKAIRSEPGNHFVGLSVRWDGEHGLTMICRVEYDHAKDE